ncbi:hypothetical protein SAMN06298216_2339 [Spirosomataceae bacterium TFI 002]|nr:hypothetical protein SAMN06298216_2339 [Spirosomataceae bacterium TFI 002]
MKLKYFLYCLIITIYTSSCGLRRIFDEGSTRLIINNNTNSLIKVISFIRGRAVGNYEIAPLTNYSKLIHARDNRYSIMPNEQTDSLVI